MPDWDHRGDLTSKEKEALEKLDELCVTFRQLEIVATLKEFPSLASKCCGHGHRKFPPLRWLVPAGASLAIVKEFVEMCPDALYWQGGDVFYVAVGHRYSTTDPEVLLFLFQEHPEILVAKPESRNPLIYDILESFRPPETKIKLLNFNPECHGMTTWDQLGRDDIDFPMYPIGHVGVPKELGSYMVDNFPSHIEKMCIRNFSRRILRILPRLKQVTFMGYDDEWTYQNFGGPSEGFGDFMKAVGKLSNLNTLRLCLNAEFPHDTQQLYATLAGSLAKNSSIRRLYFEVHDGSVPCDRVFSSVISGVKGMRQLEELELSWLMLRDTAGLAELVASGACPPSLKLDKVTLDAATWNTQADWAQSRLVKFVCVDHPVVGTSIDLLVGFLVQLCSNLALAPRLQSLQLWNMPTGLSITGAIRALLSHPTLSDLTLDGITCNARMAVEALKANETLKWFRVEHTFCSDEKQALLADALEKHNKTLEYVWIQKWGRSYGKVKYWTNLNRAGRKRAGDLETTAAEFVGLLMDAEGKKDPVGNDEYPFGRFGKLRLSCPTENKGEEERGNYGHGNNGSGDDHMASDADSNAQEEEDDEDNHSNDGTSEEEDRDDDSENDAEDEEEGESADDDDDDDQNEGKVALSLFNCHYGLLRELPSLWTSFVLEQDPKCSKKRKLEDT